MRDCPQCQSPIAGGAIVVDQVLQSKIDGSCRGYHCCAHSVGVCPVSQVLVAEEASGDGMVDSERAKVCTI